MLTRFATWWIILRISLEERLVYRGDFALGTLMRFLPVVTQIFLWGAIFASPWKRREARAIRSSAIRINDMIAYYLLVMIGRAFSSMPGLASGIARDIRTGMVKKYLIQPIDMLGFLLLYRVAHKLVYYVVAAAPFALVFFLCRGYFSGWPDAQHIAGVFRLACDVVSFGIFHGSHAGHDRILVSGSQFADVCFHAVEFLFFRAHVSPRHAAGRCGPNRKNDSIPISGLFSLGRVLGQNSRHRVAWGLGMQLVWVIFFIVASRLASTTARERYSGFGG